LGVACLRYSFAEPLTRLSYDLPFLCRSTIETKEIVLVYLDEYSAKQLNQPIDNVWNRALHARLLNRLTESGARLVLYDIVFDVPGVDPAADADFRNAIEGHGKVILGAAYDIVQEFGRAHQERVSPPIRTLRRAAAGYGVLAFKPVDPDYGVRQIYFGPSVVPSATWKALEVLGAPVTRQARDSLGQCWINYYGPADTFFSVSIAQALAADSATPEYFKDKIVLVGARSSVGYLGTSRDEFATPYARVNHRFSPGTEVHATILLNLLRGEWLMRMSPGLELAVILVVAAAAAALGFLRPGFAALVAVLISLGIICCAGALVWGNRIWFPWFVPAAVQMPLGLVWAVGSQYILESRRRKELRRAFGLYLSPEMADKIANSDFDLRPGGKLVEATIIFTDLENFTTLSEDIDPAEVSEILIAYFRQTTKCILDKHGTIIKYVGDAVMAAWGAPIDDPDHVLRATEAACDLRCLTELEVRGIKLRTRIGVHSGKVLAGNLGSEYRFDYTMIGDATNFASRLESLNKYLGTQALISDVVRQQLGNRFTTRLLGEFLVAGKTHSVIIHELICRCESENGEREWIDVFEEGLALFRAGDFERARGLMNRTRELRGGKDGPADFYLRRIEKLRTTAPVGAWNGVVELTEK